MMCWVFFLGVGVFFIRVDVRGRRTAPLIVPYTLPVVIESVLTGIILENGP